MSTLTDKPAEDLDYLARAIDKFYTLGYGEPEDRKTAIDEIQEAESGLEFVEQDIRRRLKIDYYDLLDGKKRNLLDIDPDSRFSEVVFYAARLEIIKLNMEGRISEEDAKAIKEAMGEYRSNSYPRPAGKKMMQDMLTRHSLDEVLSDLGF